jgi:hypothetical protein
MARMQLVLRLARFMLALAAAFFGSDAGRPDTQSQRPFRRK